MMPSTTRGALKCDDGEIAVEVVTSVKEEVVVEVVVEVLPLPSPCSRSLLLYISSLRRNLLLAVIPVSRDPYCLQWLSQ